MEIDILRKGNGLPLLYRDDIEKIAELYIEDFDSKLLDEPMPTPIEEFLENYLHLNMDYADITPDASILGLTAFDNGLLTVYDLENDREKNIYVKEGTVIIDNTLLSEVQKGRCRFTCGHEGGHWILHRDMFKKYKKQKDIFNKDKKEKSINCLKRNFQNYSSKRMFTTDNDWMEWHANLMASCLLMPKSTFKSAAQRLFKEAGINDDCITLGEDFCINDFAIEIPREMSKIFDVSIQAASIRLNQLRIIREKTETFIR